MVLYGRLSISPWSNPKTSTNWKKYSTDLHTAIPNPNPKISNADELDEAVSHLATAIKNSIFHNIKNLPDQQTKNYLPKKVEQAELTKKRRLRKAWQYSRDLDAKSQFNSQVE